jgi:hypothetical protein
MAGLAPASRLACRSHDAGANAPAPLKAGVMCPHADYKMIDIDKDTGTLRLQESFVKNIGPTTKLDELKSKLTSWEQADWKNEHSSLKIEMQNRQNDETVHLILYFVKSTLSSIELFFTAESLGDGRSRWSKAKEMGRKKYHELLFSSVLGKHHWGSVQSVFDKKSGISVVRLQYSNLSK